MKVILVSGPPRAGKDTLCDMLGPFLPLQHRNGYLKLRLSDPIKETAHAAHGIRCEPGDYEDTKDVPCEAMLGVTPRAAYIAAFRMLSSLHGPEVLGRRLLSVLQSLKDCRVDWVLVPDLGRNDDALPLVRGLGAENLACVELVRPGCSFRGDSREPVDLRPLGVPQLVRYNSGTLENLRACARDLASELS